jgi:hypothetical protein
MMGGTTTSLSNLEQREAVSENFTVVQTRRGFYIDQCRCQLFPCFCDMTSIEGLLINYSLLKRMKHYSNSKDSTVISIVLQRTVFILCALKQVSI